MIPVDSSLRTYVILKLIRGSVQKRNMKSQAHSVYIRFVCESRVWRAFTNRLEQCKDTNWDVCCDIDDIYCLYGGLWVGSLTNHTESDIVTVYSSAPFVILATHGLGVNLWG